MFQSLIASKNPFQYPQNINNCCLNITNNNQKPLQHPQQHQRQLSSCCFFCGYWRGFYCWSGCCCGYWRGWCRCCGCWSGCFCCCVCWSDVFVVCGCLSGCGCWKGLLSGLGTIATVAYFIRQVFILFLSLNVICTNRLM